MKDYYYILGVTQSASTDVIKKAYRKLSLKFHPDKNDGDSLFEDRFKEINEAYETLSDSDRRSNYDKGFRQKSSNQQGGPSSNATSHSNNIPRIVSLLSDKSVICIGDLITFSWNVENATVIELNLFGKVTSSGSKTIKIGNYNIDQGLLVKLHASNGDNYIQRELIINRDWKGESPELNERVKINFRIFLTISFIIFISFLLFNNYKGRKDSIKSNFNSNDSILYPPVNSSKEEEIVKGKQTKVIKTTGYSSKEVIARQQDEVAIKNSNKVQNKTSLKILKDDEVYTVVEEVPEFPEGIAGLGRFLQANIRYPLEAQRANVTGRVFLSFVVDTDGSIQKVKVLKGLGFGTDEEAARVVRAMPKWKPGRQSGRLVRVKYNLPINFSLEE